MSKTKSEQNYIENKIKKDNYEIILTFEVLNGFLKFKDYCVQKSYSNNIK